MKSRRFEGIAEPVADPARIADFTELRLRGHPKMMGTILPSWPFRSSVRHLVSL